MKIGMLMTMQHDQHFFCTWELHYSGLLCSESL